MIVRAAETEDIPGLTALARRTYREAFGETMSTDDLRFVLEEKLTDDYFGGAIAAGTVLVAESDGALVGFIEAGAASLPVAGRRPGDQEIRRAYVRADVQGQGIGGRLMAAILAEPAIAAAGTVYLDVWEGNHRAQAFYRRHGFTVVGAHELTLAGEPLDEPELIMARRR